MQLWSKALAVLASIYIYASCSMLLHITFLFLFFFSFFLFLYVGYEDIPVDKISNKYKYKYDEMPQQNARQKKTKAFFPDGCYLLKNIPELNNIIFALYCGYVV